MKKAKLLGLSTILIAGSFVAAGCNSSSYQIGILLPVEQEALETCQKGFVDGLVASGLSEGKDFKVVIRNAGGKDADLVSYAKDLVSSSSMTFGLGTGAATALKAAAVDVGSINPILFSAVTDPFGSSLVSSLELLSV